MKIPEMARRATRALVPEVVRKLGSDMLDSFAGLTEEFEYEARQQRDQVANPGSGQTSAGGQ